MFDSVSRYFQTLTSCFGEGWNRFWFTPCDPLPLCAIRVAAGAIALYALVALSWDLQRFFAADGMFPPAVVRQLEGETSFSYLNYLSQPRQLWGAHAAALAILLLFTLGLKTRVSGVLSLLVLLSYAHRAPMLTSPLEPLTSMVLCYLCLGPSGACLSLDALLASRRTSSPAALPAAAPRTESFSAGISLRLIQVHTALIYGMQALAKLAPPPPGPDVDQPWWTGKAMWWLVSRPDFRIVDLAPWLHDHLLLVNLWTHGVVLFQGAFCVLVWNRTARPLLVFSAVLFWVGYALATGRCGYALMMITASSAFLPPETFRALAACCPPCRPRR